MKFSCSRNDLLNALNIVSKGVSTRSTMDILQGILFTVYDHKLRLTATDLEIGVKTEIPADTQTDGEVILNANLITDVIRKLSGDEVYFESDEKNRVKIENLLSEFILNGLPVHDFPDFPQISEEYSFFIAADLLREMIRATKDSVAISESIPVLTGIKLEIDKKDIRMVSLDGYRLALKQNVLEEGINDTLSVIIPGNALKELYKLLAGVEDPVKIEFSKSQIFFQIGETVFTSRLLEGEFVSYEGIIPKQNTSEVIISKDSLLHSCERAALLAKAGKNNLIKMDFEPDQLTITSNADVGGVHEVIKAENNGDSLKIAFNSKFFIDALKVIDDDQIRIGLTTAYGPAVINPVDGNSYTYMILPVRVSE
ncbi:MAG: DNA polymerase III subunit beta [Eubacteriaceae bacterium]|jgi:DNA polymerase-3 subunit beta